MTRQRQRYGRGAPSSLLGSKVRVWLRRLCLALDCHSEHSNRVRQARSEIINVPVFFLSNKKTCSSQLAWESECLCISQIVLTQPALCHGWSCVGKGLRLRDSTPGGRFLCKQHNPWLEMGIHEIHLVLQMLTQSPVPLEGEDVQHLHLDRREAGSGTSVHRSSVSVCPCPGSWPLWWPTQLVLIWKESGGFEMFICMLTQLSRQSATH